MSWWKDYLGKIEQNKKNWENGYYNCIPFINMDRLTGLVPGLEKSTYYLVTASTGIGKSKFSRFLFAHSPFEYKRLNPSSPVTFKVLFFSLEESKESFNNSEVARHLFLKYNKKVSKRDLMSVGKKNTIDKATIDLIKKSTDDLGEFFDCVEVIDDIRNPFGIYKKCRDYLESRGTVSYKKLVKSDGTFKKDANGQDALYFDKYTPHNPYEYTIIIVDHAALLTPEPTRNQRNIKDAISNLSSRRFLELRDRYQATLVLVQQQNASTDEKNKFLKDQNKQLREPSLANLGEHKLTQQDCNVAFGLYSPGRFENTEYRGYNIKKLQGKFRNLSILKNRDGIPDKSVGMYFDGATGIFKELPHFKDNDGLAEIYKLIENNKI